MLLIYENTILYAELSGVDLFMADLKALEAYAVYYYSLSKIWTKPLPEVYDPQSVAEYFGCRPHVVGLRLLEVFFNLTYIMSVLVYSLHLFLCELHLAVRELRTKCVKRDLELRNRF